VKEMCTESDTWQTCRMSDVGEKGFPAPVRASDLHRWLPNQIVFVAGTAKSGSTILDRLLATQPGFIGLGEVDHMVVDEKLNHERAKSYGSIEDLPCSCGERLHGCLFWGPVMERILDGSLETHFSRYLSVVERANELLTGIDGSEPNPGFDSVVIVDSSKEVVALRRVLQFVAGMNDHEISLSVVVTYRDPRDWLVSDDLKEASRGRKRGLRVRLRRLQKWHSRYEEILREIDLHNLPSLISNLSQLQREPLLVLGRVLNFLERPTQGVDVADLENANSHVVWGSHHRLDAKRANHFWKSTHLRRVDIWFLPWLFSPRVWPMSTTVKKLRQLSKAGVN